jgi:hypothetical protein
MSDVSRTEHKLVLLYYRGPKHMIDSPRKREQVAVLHHGVEASMHTNASMGQKEANKGSDSMMAIKAMLSSVAASSATCN